MRVLVATDRIGSLSSQRAGTLLGSGWPAAEVVVVPLGEAGSGFAAAAADQLGLELVASVSGDRLVSLASGRDTELVSVETAHQQDQQVIPFAASSADLGLAVLQALRGSATVRRLVVDLTGPAVHDGGAGLLSVLGAEGDVALDQGVSQLAALTTLDLAAARARLTGMELIGVVPSAEVAAPLLGLRGITSMRSQGSTMDRTLLLDTDAALANFAELAAPEHAQRPGAGACGGLGFAVLALGGRLVCGPRFAFEDQPVPAQEGLDLVVTGCTVFDFARRGGGVVAEAARLAGEHLVPCIAVAAEVLIGGREMRTMGIESAYQVREPTVASLHGGDVSEAELTATARRIGRSWSW